MNKKSFAKQSTAIAATSIVIILFSNQFRNTVAGILTHSFSQESIAALDLFNFDLFNLQIHMISYVIPFMHLAHASVGFPLL